MPFFRAKPLWLGLFALIAVAAHSGCQCCPALDCYAGVIDDISDHECELDPLYCPCFDLTRIGKPDWCECCINRVLWGTHCCEECYYGCERGCCDDPFLWHPRRTW
jgi:hypothetical protein